jgi:hypothetical protein
MLEIGAPALGDPSIPNDCPGKARLTVEEARGSFGAWCATRRLHAGRFVWRAPEPDSVAPALQLSTQQFEALALGLPWQRLGELATIRRC